MTRSVLKGEVDVRMGLPRVHECGERYGCALYGGTCNIDRLGTCAYDVCAGKGRRSDERNQRLLGTTKGKSQPAYQLRHALNLLGSAQLHREHLRRPWMAILKRSTNLRQLDADTTKLNQIVRPADKLDRPIMQELSQHSQYTISSDVARRSSRTRTISPVK